MSDKDNSVGRASWDRVVHRIAETFQASPYRANMRAFGEKFDLPISVSADETVQTRSEGR